MLADHLALLAPGAAIGDFVLASNHFDGAIRSVGFYQRALGRRVVGGQVSFRFKADRLFVIGSEASQREDAEPRSRCRRPQRAAASLRADLALPAGQVSPLGTNLLLVADDAILGFRSCARLIDGAPTGATSLRRCRSGAVWPFAAQPYAAAPCSITPSSIRRGRASIAAPVPHVIVNGTPNDDGRQREWDESPVRFDHGVRDRREQGGRAREALFALQPAARRVGYERDRADERRSTPISRRSSPRTTFACTSIRRCPRSTIR
jgi:hypothetical protein